MGPSLNKYLPESLISVLGFSDEGFESYQINVRNRLAFSYLGQRYNFLSDETRTNFVVIGVTRKNYFDPEKRDRRLDWYFGVFDGPHTGQVKEKGEVTEIFNNLRRIVARKNRIPITRLEGILNRELKN